MREWERGPAMRIDPVRPADFKSLPKDNLFSRGLTLKITSFH